MGLRRDAVTTRSSDASPGGPGSEARLLDELVESAPDAMVVVDDGGRILLANRQTESLFGYPREELTGRPIELLVPDRLRSTHRQDRADYTDSPVLRPMGLGRTLHARRRDGSEFPVEISLAPLHLADGLAVAAAVRDVSDRIQIQQELERLALHDQLTGLANRGLVMEQLQRALARRARTGRLAVAFVDLDRLKWVNDTLGHEAGDRLIVCLAQRLRQVLRPADTLGRFGGDEFVAVVEDLAGPDELVALAQRMLTAVRAPLLLSGRELRPTVSLGLALAEEGMDADTLIHDADAAMYRAKHRGRDRFEVYEPSGDEQTQADLDLHADLSRAVHGDRLPVHYQPVLDLRDDTLWGAEALVRWTSPQHGPVDALRVITLAERTSLVLELDACVLRRACRDLARFPEELVPRVGVNISARHLTFGDLPQLVRTALAASRLAPHRLWLELTESEQLTHDEVLPVLAELERLGVTLALDDFGTGFSSLSRLRDLPVRVLKVDRAFSTSIASDYRSEALVAAVVGLGHALGQDVVVEGVETAEQLAALHRLGCDLGQGYHWARAMPADELREWALRRQRASTETYERSAGPTYT
jgi:diguanylate cyclase (GGDEF)-like protein/PAS domain S-box-containing protein